MQKLDALVVGAIEMAQIPVSFEEVKSFLPNDHIFLELWPTVADISILHPLQAINVVERLDSALNHPGDVIECGIFQGATSILIAKLMEIRQSSKKLYLFDSFQGLPEPDRQVDTSMNFKIGGWAAKRSEVEELLAKYQVSERCIINEGWFSDTLPTLEKDQMFCFAYIDADLYSSTVDCLTNLWPRLGPKSVALFDDYHHPSGGVRKAVDEWFSESEEIIHVGPASQCFVTRGLNKDEENIECFYLQTANGKEILVSFESLRNNRLFGTLIERRLNQLSAYAEQLNTFARLITDPQSAK